MNTSVRTSRIFIVALFACILATSLFASTAYADENRKAMTTEDSQATSAKSIPMYRLLNPKTQEHFFTRSVNEKRVLTQQKGWVFEGVAWYAPEKSNTPVYRLYKDGAHHYTMSVRERDTLKKRGWRYEGIGWYSDDAKAVPVYRVYKPDRPLVSSHHYTTSARERGILISSKGWKDEQIGWYAVALGHSVKDGWVKQGNSYAYYYEGTQAAPNTWIVTSQRPTEKSDKGIRRYRIGENGLVKTGFFTVGNDHYYGIPTKLHMVYYAHHHDTTHTLVADSKGRLYNGKSGWAWSTEYTADKSKQRFYFEKTKDGKAMSARVGVFTKDGKKYYGYPTKGYVARNQDNLVAEGMYYKASSQGVLSTDSIIGKMLKKAQGYSSKSKYLLMVDIDDCYTVVFQGKKGAWKIKYVWLCCTGRPDTPTPTGTFSVLWKVDHFGEDHGYSCYYWTGFTTLGENYGFHSRIYYPYTHSPRYLKDGRLGERVSRGCVRLADENAIWVQKNCPKGTAVICTK